MIGKIAAISIICWCCGKVFAMDRREILWYSNMGYPLPKRCPECRKKRKEMKALEKRVAALEKQAQEQQKTNKVDITFSKPTQQLSDQLVERVLEKILEVLRQRVCHLDIT